MHKAYSVEGQHTNEVGAHSRGRGLDAVERRFEEVYDRVAKAGGKVVATHTLTTPSGPQPNIAGTPPWAGGEVLYVIADFDETSDAQLPDRSSTNPVTS